MKFINIGEGAKVDGLKLTRNTVVTDDMAQVVFVDIGKNGEVINLDAEGNQVLTPEAYKDLLNSRTQELKLSINEFSEQLKLIENDIAKAKINRQLKIVQEELNLIPESSERKFNYNRALSQLKDTCVNLGYGVLAGIITTKLGF
ncbi:hypothetical protein PVK64_19720 [Aliivibrio sp. S4TY2]|uniref:hypothetical protein n=1 Tax=unclassified Aliivibrio TaxID=2645654 RepID=UPI00237924F8|nr:MULTISPECIES: hypothetical protein [unclassified Aliivibrio]MDD9158397.1 hypothetical protein [Aliivibrio sp. S4TY2]MDD9162397.1 hypothetical protein [Aliivibrio sp. S4TY1]MDD9166404.1 hypothetical protein [Aliivibrio sp. S4MY2]MDD9170402.1 hypothetical protein [Aliivibrio sp. S4MY4]MDD9187488.1 hypothetical protein [Aliivibrio sp. S4MY3]